MGPYYFTEKKLPLHVNLLLINQGNKNHYCWIKDMSRLISSQINNMCNKKYFCDGCLIYFYSKEKLDLHQMHDCNHVFTKNSSTEIKINKYGQLNS